LAVGWVRPKIGSHRVQKQEDRRSVFQEELDYIWRVGVAFSPRRLMIRRRSCERAEMFEARIEQRTSAVFADFVLPSSATARGGD
jgi:hypothetical protein